MGGGCGEGGRGGERIFGGVRVRVLEAAGEQQEVEGAQVAVGVGVQAQVRGVGGGARGLELHAVLRDELREGALDSVHAETPQRRAFAPQPLFLPFLHQQLFTIVLGASTQ